MACFLPHVKTHFSSQFLIPNSNNIAATHNLQFPGNVGSYRLRQPLLSIGKMYILSAKCGKGDSIGKIERKLLEKQIGMEEDLTRIIGKQTGKCEEVGGGMVELLECLEREAIMGDDEGKEPMDYNRRAQIFDESSRVFQALKERSEITTTSNG